MTCPPTSRHRSCFPPEVHINTGRLCSAGSGCHAVPRRHRSYAALRLPAPIGHGSGSPCQRPTSMRTLVLCPRADDTCARNAPRVGDGSPALRHTGMSSRRGEGLPGYWAVLFVRAVVEHPAGYDPLLAQLLRRGSLLPSGKTAPSASGKTIGFGAACPTAHTLACLRIAGLVSATVARLATGSGGLTLGRAGFAPAGR